MIQHDTWKRRSEINACQSDYAVSPGLQDVWCDVLVQQEHQNLDK